MRCFLSGPTTFSNKIAQSMLSKAKAQQLVLNTLPSGQTHMAPSVSPVITSPFAENAMQDTYFGLWFFCLNRIGKGCKGTRAKWKL